MTALPASVEIADLVALDRFAERLAATIRLGDWIWLEGDLGAGKTTLVRAILRAWGIEENITSPTYVLMNEYEHPRWEKRIYHIDAYRLSGDQPREPIWDLEALKNGIVFVEWPERSGLSKDRFSLKISIAHGPQEQSRVIQLISKPFS